MIDSLKSLFHDIFSTFTFVSAIDILLTAVLIYYVLKWIKGTQAQQVAKGIVIVLLITQLSDWLGLVTIHYIFKSMITVGLIALVVMFQPELRRALEKLGSTKLNSVFPALTRTEKEIDIYDVIEEIIDSVKELSASKTGALIVFERNIKLNYIAETGIVLDALSINHCSKIFSIPTHRCMTALSSSGVTICGSKRQDAFYPSRKTAISIKKSAPVIVPLSA
jgi:diadenylate cyclase